MPGCTRCCRLHWRICSLRLSEATEARTGSGDVVATPLALVAFLLTLPMAPAIAETRVGDTIVISQADPGGFLRCWRQAADRCFRGR